MNLKARIRRWLDVPEHRVIPMTVSKRTQEQECEDIAQDAGDVIVACRHRLASDRVLLGMCARFLSDNGPRISTLFYYAHPIAPLVPEAYAAVEKQAAAIRLRLARAKVAEANAALKKLEAA